MDMIRENHSRLHNEWLFLHNVLERFSKQSNVFWCRENRYAIMCDDSKKIGATRNIYPFVITHDNSLSVFMQCQQRFAYAGLRLTHKKIACNTLFMQAYDLAVGRDKANAVPGLIC